MPEPMPDPTPPPEPAPPPPPDADRDGLPDALDNCPETIGAPDQQGCTTAQRVKLTATRVELLEPLTFARGATKLRGTSSEVLDDAAQVIRSHPELMVVIHAYAANAKLARKRGTEVLRYLVRNGVDVRRIDAKGHAIKPPGADRIELVIPPPK
jgi:outer membrane protein OmpA-like peptidoglycan-associated protein